MMNTSEEWKSIWPISSVHSPPLLLSSATAAAAEESPNLKKIGPVIFNPQTHHHLFFSPSLSPNLPPPFSNLSLPRFLHTSAPLLPSTSTSFGSQFSSCSSKPNQLLAHNSLQLLRCPGSNSTLAFFPTGSNSDQVGFVLLSVEDSQLRARGVYGKTAVFTSKNALTHRIFNILVNPLADSDFTSGDACYSTIGYLLVCTAYSVHWYGVRIKNEGSGLITPALELLGSKLFKNSAVVHACWSPHIPEESLVLLESGEVFLFDLDSCYETANISLKLTGKKVKISWNQSLISEKGGWLSCDFSWHPRILIVAHSSVVFLVDSRSENCNVSCLLKLDLFDADCIVSDGFLAFSIAAPDRFYFTLASNRLIFLCDIRKPMSPVIRWAHGVVNPSYILVTKLSELRSQPEDVSYAWASEKGYGILLGSFWNSEFSLFCFGPDVRGSISSEISAFSRSFYAWGLPSDVSLDTGDCHCGSCLVKEEFFKDTLPNWINWQKKKEIVLGFGILDNEIASQLCEPEPDNFGGFTLIRLTSLGNLESQRYCASWDYLQASKKGHNKHTLDLEDSLLYETGEETYKFHKKFHYLKLDWLNGYLNSNLDKILARELIRNSDEECPKTKASFGHDFHENICQKLKAFEFEGQHILEVHDVLRDMSLPTSIHEIALRSICTNLPKNVLRLGFSTYSDLQEVLVEAKYVPVEFLEVPCGKTQLPPFSFRNPSSRSNKWSRKRKPSNFLVGPVIPVPILIAFHKAHALKAVDLSVDFEIDVECDKVMRVANEVTNSNSQICCNENVVSLADDKEDIDNTSTNSQLFASYKPVGLSSKLSLADPIVEDSVYNDEKYTNLIFRVGQKDGKEAFDSECPLKFKFDDDSMSFGPKEVKTYKLLKRQYSNFKDGFNIYQDFLNKSNIQSLLQ